MPTEDDQSHEISAFFEQTPAGFKAGIRSRAVSAIDFMFGRFISRKARRDQRVEDALTDQDIRLIEKLGDMRLERLHRDPGFAAAAMEQHFATAVRREDNKVEVMKLALEDLRDQPPTGDGMQGDGPDVLDDDFLIRFERYAEDASVKEVRERWARVLVSEIRQPGTFSAKVLRLIDETGPSTAKLFEDLCRHRVGNGIVQALAPPLDYLDTKRLVAAGLFVEQGAGGQVAKATRLDGEGGVKYDYIKLGDFVLGLRADADIPRYGASERQPITKAGPVSGIPIIVLTDEGHAISSIIESDEAASWDRFMTIAAQAHPSIEFQDLRPLPDGRRHLFQTLNAQSTAS